MPLFQNKDGRSYWYCFHCQQKLPPGEFNYCAKCRAQMAYQQRQALLWSLRCEMLDIQEPYD